MHETVATPIAPYENARGCILEEGLCMPGKDPSSGEDPAQDHMPHQRPSTADSPAHQAATDGEEPHDAQCRTQPVVQCISRSRAQPRIDNITQPVAQKPGACDDPCT